ncbi:MAG: ankyrin repeat domain-containing protein [Pseudomonadota bacterium]
MTLYATIALYFLLGCMPSALASSGVAYRLDGLHEDKAVAVTRSDRDTYLILVERRIRRDDREILADRPVRTGFMVVEVDEKGDRLNENLNIDLPGELTKWIGRSRGAFYYQSYLFDRTLGRWAMRIIRIGLDGWAHVLSEEHNAVDAVPISPGADEFLVMVQRSREEYAIFRVRHGQDASWVQTHERVDYWPRGLFGTEADALRDVVRGRFLELYRNSDDGFERLKFKAYDPEFSFGSGDQMFVLKRIGGGGRFGYGLEVLVPPNQHQSASIDGETRVLKTPGVHDAVQRDRWIMGHVSSHGYAAYLMSDGSFRETRIDLGGSLDRIVDAIEFGDEKLSLLVRTDDHYHLAHIDLNGAPTCLSNQARIVALEKELREQHAIVAYSGQVPAPSGWPDGPPRVINLADACQDAESKEQTYLELLLALAERLPPRPDEIRVRVTPGESYRYLQYARPFVRGGTNARVDFSLTLESVDPFVRTLIDELDPHLQYHDQLRARLIGESGIDRIQISIPVHGRASTIEEESARVEDFLTELIEAFEQHPQKLALIELPGSNTVRWDRSLNDYLAPDDYDTVNMTAKAMWLYSQRLLRGRATMELEWVLADTTQSGRIVEPTESGRTRAKETLNAAALRGQLVVVQRMLNEGEDPNRYDRGYAVADGVRYPEIVEVLLAAGADPDSTDSRGRWAIMEAVRRDNRSLRLLLEHGASVDVRSSDGTTALHFAAASNNVVAARLLVEAGAEVNVEDESGIRPLHAAGASPDVAKLLLAAGAEAESEDHEGQSIAHFAAARWLGLEVLRMLSDRGVNLDGTDQRGKRPIDLARENRQYLNIRFLESRPVQ